MVGRPKLEGKPMNDLTTKPSVISNHVQWLADWRAARDAFEAIADGATGADKIAEDTQALSVRLATTPASSTEGIAAQITWFKEDLGYYVRDNVSPELGQIFDTLEKGAVNIGA